MLSAAIFVVTLRAKTEQVHFAFGAKLFKTLLSGIFKSSGTFKMKCVLIFADKTYGASGLSTTHLKI